MGLDVRGRIERMPRPLGAAGQRVAAIILKRPAAVLAGSAAEIANLARTSDATVVRTIQMLGYKGLGDLKQALAASLDQAATPADKMRNTLSLLQQDTYQALDAVLRAHDGALEVLRSPAFRQEMSRGLQILHAADRIVTFGIGPSGHLARYLATLLTRCGRRSIALDAAGTSLADQLLSLQEGDGILALAYGRPYPEVTAVIREAQRLAIPTVLISDSSTNPLVRDVDATLVLPRGEHDHVALHGGTLVALEAIALTLAATRPERTLETLDRLNRLRGSVSGK